MDQTTLTILNEWNGRMTNLLQETPYTTTPTMFLEELTEKSICFTVKGLFYVDNGYQLQLSSLFDNLPAQYKKSFGLSVDKPQLHTTPHCCNDG